MSRFWGAVCIALVVFMIGGLSGCRSRSSSPTPTPLPTATATAVAAAPLATVQALLRASTPTATARATATPLPTAKMLATSADDESAIVVAVIDGDTIDVQVAAGQVLRVRYTGIDTPERGEPGFERATIANEALVLAQSVRLQRDISDSDRNGRLLRYVFLEDGSHVNAMLVEQGLALPAEYPPDLHFAEEFQRLATEAARAGRGFWAGGDESASYALTTATANLRAGPGIDFATIATIAANTPLAVVSRNDDGSWLWARSPARVHGWVPEAILMIPVPVDTLPLAENIPQLADANVNSSAAAAVAVTEAPSAVANGVGAVELIILENNGNRELLGIVNQRETALDISGWQLSGSRGEDRCIVPAATLLQPGQTYEIASGESEPGAIGMKCTNTPIWNNSGETIFLETSGGVIQIESQRR